MSFSGAVVIRDLQWLNSECERRCIFDTLKWSSELLFYAPKEWHKAFSEEEEQNNNLPPESSKLQDNNIRCRANFGRSLLINEEHYRAVFFLEPIKDESNFDRFMYYWARYLAYEKNRLESESEAIDRRCEYDNSEMDTLHADLCDLGAKNPDYFDAFLLYVLGKVRMSLKLVEKAEEAFVASVLSNRAFWPSWQELVHCISTPDKGLRSELANLTHSFYKTHKFSWEVCCAVANYYSLRGDHEKSVVFLVRSLKLNPNNSSVWTLIGHEFMEQKNNSAACLSYRKAIQSDPKDYRGWYGLGQLYDILKMPSYSLYYYQQAHKCKSDDSRMLVALGEVYTRLHHTSDAQKCLLKAFKVGDVEGTALMLLGRLYEKGKDNDQASIVYEKYLETYCDDLMSDLDNMAHCCCFLAKYFLSKNDLNAAGSYAQRCLQYESSKEEGRRVLRQINQALNRLANSKDHPAAPSQTIAVVTSTPADQNTNADYGMQVNDATPITPILSQQLNVRTVGGEEGETEMAISSDEEEDSEGY
ncbi:unnamed protein product [Anisakis simplex]|uniref:TPR_REGION domain-containing protein n=1 Tax=Anisakis simplex TaxID=6269 RepID=A0A0M3K622_ANISI|nr:unnamed protein product [Anisakis simplex]